MNKSKLIYCLSYLTAVILVLIPFQAILTIWAGSNFGHLDLFRAWKELILIVLAICTLVVACRQQQIKKWLFSSPLVMLILVFTMLQVGMGIVALQANRVNSSALIYGLLINLRYLAFFIICIVLAASSDWLRLHWKKIILVPAAAVIGFGLLQHFVLPNDWLTHFGYGPKTIPAFQAVDRKPDFVRLQSTLRGANPLGAYLLVILTLIWGLWLRNIRRAQALILGMAGLTVLYFTYSRSAWLGAFVSCVALAFWLLKTKKQKQKLALASLIAVLIMAIVIVVWQSNSVLQNTLFHTSNSSQSSESSNSVRTEALLDGTKSVIKQPFGEGPGTAGPASTRNSQPARISENYFIQLGQEVGWIGLGLFIAINIYVGKLLWRSQDWLAKTMLASLLGLTIVNMLSHAWADDTLAYIFWGLTGIALAPSVILNKERKHSNGKNQEKSAKKT